MIDLHIILKDDGAVTVNGPLDQKILCYGMMEIAKEIIKDFKKSDIVIPEMKIVKGN